jgi:hypothetical protein
MQYEMFEDKGQSVAVNRSKSDNTMAVNRSTMAKRKGTRGQAKIHKKHTEI